MKIPLANILWRHCSECGSTIRSLESRLCSICAHLQDMEMKVPEVQEFTSDITDAYDEVLPEMENDIRWGGKWTEG